MSTPCSTCSPSPALKLQPTLAETCLQALGEHRCAPFQNALPPEKQATGFATELRKIFASMVRF